MLARKCRPQHFRDMAGQTHVLQALVNALDSNRLHHAYLFTGTRGVGKTTIARILAKCLNCETGVSSQPCGQCGACVAIAEGRFVDLIEIDAASHTGVDDVRDLIDNSQYMPTLGRFKVYLIDEVHMLSKSAFNALLKTLEEPPAHVKFLLATTDPHKLPVTVLSRCLQFNLKNLSPEKIAEYLRSVLEKEMIPFDDGALRLLSRAADGSMRDALSLTDQAIAFGGEKLVQSAVQEMLGTLDLELIHPLMDALIAQDAKAMLAAVAHMAEQNPDFPGALDELLRLLHQIAMAQAVPDMISHAPDESPRLEKLASSLTAEDVQLFYQIGLAAQRDLDFAPDLRSGFEMALLRMLAFRPEGVFDTGGGAAKKKTELTATRSQTSPDQAAGLQTTHQPVSGQPGKMPSSHARQLLEDTFNEPSAPQTLSMPAMSVRQSTPASMVTERSASAESSFTTHAASTSAPVLTRDNWPAIWQMLPLAGVIRNTASHCSLDQLDGTQLHFTLDEHHCSLFDESHTRRLNEALNSFLGMTFTVHIHTGTPTVATPFQTQQLKRAELQKAAEQAFEEDEKVKALLRHFDGTIVAGSISPLPKTLH